jgi:3-oxoacyl-(acyl-carrier-protein) synthase
LDLVMTPRNIRVDRLLCLSFGFGGQNAAIALQRWVD